MKGLGSKERKILAAAHFRAGEPVSTISELSGLSSSTVNYYLNKFRSEGLIKKWAFINPYALPYREYTVYFSLSSTDKPTKKKLAKYISEHNKVLWFARVGSEYQYSMTILASGAEEANNFLEHLACKFGDMFYKKAFSVIVSFRIYPKRYLHQYKQDQNQSLVVEKTDKEIQLDETDKKILSAHYSTDFDSLRDLARELGMPNATVNYRIKRLEEQGVILRYIYLIRARKLGVIPFRILVYSRGIQAELTEEMDKFCKAEPAIVNMSHCLGSWDYELTAEVFEAADVTDLAEKLYAKFKNRVIDLQLIPIFSQKTSTGLHFA